MIEKIDIRQIVIDHCSTFVSSDMSRRSLDYFLFFIVPLMVSLIMLWFDVYIDEEAVGVLITAMAIFAGLLFNLILLVHSIIVRVPDEPPNARKRVLLRHLYANISYAILVAILCILPLLAVVLGDAVEEHTGWISMFEYFLLTNFFLTLFMILKRIHVLLAEEFRRKDN